MLFNSNVFILTFLPLTLAGFLLCTRLNRSTAKFWLIGASLFFYGFWEPKYLVLLIGSTLFNYWIGTQINDAIKSNVRKAFLIFGVATNLGLLGYFKYAAFSITILNRLSGIELTVPKVVLPLAISFFTFTQIAYLVDQYREERREQGFLDYSLFVSFFPHLIAGPIVHHRDLIPQFNGQGFRLNRDDFNVGLTIFLIGLSKKLVIADSVAVFVGPVFNAAAYKGTVTFLDAWGGALAYTLQLYFDFSGYSDMAIGLARMFGVKFPLNFDSPYKATSIIDFWRRWHITLSNFLRDYLYIPLGGSRKGQIRRYVNLMLTMLLGGLWHGAGWTFVYWGGLHGFYLTINHGWRALGKKLDWKLKSPLATTVSTLFTFVCVVVGWTIFRSTNIGSAAIMLRAMVGRNGVSLPESWQGYLTVLQPLSAKLSFSRDHILQAPTAFAIILLLLSVAWFAPNTQQLMANTEPALEKIELPASIQWQPRVAAGLLLGLLLFLSLKRNFAASPSVFLYFNF